MMEKKVLKFILGLLTFGLAVFCLSGCQEFKDIRVTSCSLVSLTPKGFRSADAVLALGVDNPAMPFRISDLKGEIVRDDVLAATFSAGTVSVEGRTQSVYYFPCSASIEENVSIMELAALAVSKDLTGYKLNIEFRVSPGNGKGRLMQFKDIEISDLVKK